MMGGRGLDLTQRAERGEIGLYTCVIKHISFVRRGLWENGTGRDEMVAVKRRQVHLESTPNSLYKFACTGILTTHLCGFNNVRSSL